MTMARAWQDFTWTDLTGDAPKPVAILPIAAIEQHGPHLPLGVDALINEAILTRALAQLPDTIPACALPMQVIGHSVEHTRFPGTLTASAETLIALWTSIGHSVARAGISKLILFNTHGGNPPISDIVCRRLRDEAGMLAVSCFAGRLGLPEGLTISATERKHGYHGGLVETSIMLAIRPDLVRMDRAVHFRSAWIDRTADNMVLEPEGVTQIGWLTQDLHPSGALGDASTATAEFGERLLNHAAARLAALIAEVYRLDIATFLRPGPLG